MIDRPELSRDRAIVFDGIKERKITAKQIETSDFYPWWSGTVRNLTILLLFPVHTFMIWNDLGFRFYIWQGESKILSTLIMLINPWFMPILFVLAGMSAPLLYLKAP